MTVREQLEQPLGQPGIQGVYPSCTSFVAIYLEEMLPPMLRGRSIAKVV